MRDRQIHIGVSSKSEGLLRRYRWALIAAGTGLVSAAVVAGVFFSRSSGDSVHRPRAPVTEGNPNVTDGSAPSMQPRRVALAIASLDSGKIASADVNLLAIADLGAAEPGAKVNGKDDDSQSDYEVVTSKVEPLHPVASVPMDQSTQPLVKVPMALVGLTVSSSRNVPGAGMLSSRDLANRPFADLGGNSTAFASAPGQRWSLEDDAPVASPDAMFKGQTLADESLRPFIERWQAASSQGHENATTSPSLEDLSKAIAESKLSWIELYELGRFAACMDGPAVRIPFYRQAIRSEEWSFDDSTVSPRDLRVMETLVGTFLWARKDDAIAIQGLKVLMDWEKQPDSGLFDQVVLADADVLDREDAKHEGDLLASLQKLLKPNEAMSQAEQLELRWALGRALYRSGGYAASAAELSAVVQADTPYSFTPHAQVLLTLALAKGGNATEAQRVYEGWDPKLRKARSDKTDPVQQRDIAAALALLRP